MEVAHHIWTPITISNDPYAQNIGQTSAIPMECSPSCDTWIGEDASEVSSLVGNR